MINNDRIVPVTKTDLLTLYGNIMALAGTTVAAVSAETPAVFKLTEGSGNLLADEPVKSLDFGESVTSATVYFIPATDFEGFSIAGTAAVTAGVSVEPDGCTLYTAALSSGAITIAKVGF